MTLSNIEIEEAIHKRLIVIDPYHYLKSMDTNALDLHLGATIRQPKRGMQIMFNPQPEGIAQTMQMVCEKIDLTTLPNNEIWEVSFRTNTGENQLKHPCRRK